MSENEIKPVAWCAPDSLNAAKFGGLAMITSNNKHGCSEPLYDQSAIDRLTAERDAAQMVCAEAYQVVGSLLSDLGQFDTAHGEKILDNLSDHRLVHDNVLPWPSFEGEAQRKLSVAVSEGKGLVADAERYRWLREYSAGQYVHPIVVSQRKALFDTMQYTGPLIGDGLDAAIDAARAEGGV